jgi:hypothetical protein
MLRGGKKNYYSINIFLTIIRVHISVSLDLRLLSINKSVTIGKRTPGAVRAKRNAEINFLTVVIVPVPGGGSCANCVQSLDSEV